MKLILSGKGREGKGGGEGREGKIGMDLTFPFTFPSLPFLSDLPHLIFFPNNLKKFPPQGGGKGKNIHPCEPDKVDLF